MIGRLTSSAENDPSDVRMTEEREVKYMLAGGG
jgi:hypothetical protein